MHSSRRIAFGAAAAFGAALAACGCATIPSGQAGVLVTAHGVSATPLGEGVHVVPPFAHVDVYDLRGQERDEDLHALSADGAPLEARASLITYHLIPNELIAVDRELGPAYYDTIIRPLIRSTVRRVLARYRADQIDAGTILDAQREATALAQARLRPFHIAVDSMDMRRLAVVLSREAYAPVEQAAALEQEVLARPQKLELARRRAEASREEARAVAAAHALVAPTLTREVLEDESRRAQAKLLAAPSTSTVVVDDHEPFLLEIAP